MADVSALFHGSARVAIASSATAPHPLSPAELAAVENAVPARQAEFRDGRSCAKIALSLLGFQVQAIPRGKDRAPVWPVGVVGSITHCEGFCAAAAALIGDVESLGFDAEVAGGNRADTRALTVSDEEIDAYPDDPTRQFDWDTAAFSAKEAFYKAYFPLTRTNLEFLDVGVRFGLDEPAGGPFAITLLNMNKPRRDVAARMIGRWRVVGKLILCGAYLPPESRAGST